MTGPSHLRRFLTIAVLVVACGSMVGCQDEPDINDPVVGDEDTSDATEPTDGTSDTADTNEDGITDSCSGDACDEQADGSGGDTCEGDSCGGPPSQCEQPIQAGQLTANNPLNVDDQLPPDAPDALTTDCSSDEEGPERVIQFTADEALQVTLSTSTTGSLDIVTEARSDWCMPSNAPPEGEGRFCASADNSFFAPAGSTWFVVVERSAGIGGDFELDITGEQACSFGGINDTTCSQGSYKECVRNDQGDITTDEFSCPTTCGGDQCEGATCQNAITINGNQTVSGELSAFTNDLNLSKTETSCPVNGVDVDAAGPEMIFRIPSTSPGETIQVETSPDIETFYGFVTKNCPLTSSMVFCRKTWDSNGEFVVPQDGGGDYYIVIDRATVGGSSSFTFDFTRQGP